MDCLNIDLQLNPIRPGAHIAHNNSGNGGRGKFFLVHANQNCAHSRFDHPAGMNEIRYETRKKKS